MTAKGTKTGKEFPCEKCGKMQYREPYQVKRIESGEQRSVFCGSCRNAHGPHGRLGKEFPCEICGEVQYRVSWKAKLIEAGKMRVFCGQHMYTRGKAGKEFPCDVCGKMHYRAPAAAKQIESGKLGVLCAECNNGQAGPIKVKERREQGLGPGNGRVPTFHALSAKVVDADADDIEALWNKQKGICPICKERLDSQCARGWAPSMDAIDPFLEPENHVLSNCWILCWECNKQKNDYLLTNLFVWVQRVAKAQAL